MVGVPRERHIISTQRIITLTGRHEGFNEGTPQHYWRNDVKLENTFWSREFESEGKEEKGRRGGEGGRAFLYSGVLSYLTRLAFPLT